MIYNYATGEIAELLKNPFVANPTREDFSSLRKASLNGVHRGAVEIEAKEESPTAVVTYSYSVESGQFKYRFDAKSSLAAIEGSLEGATYRWIFEDGTELMGAEIEKIFSSSGSKSVTLIVTDKEGRTGTIRKAGVYVYDTTILNTDFESPLHETQYGFLILGNPN